MMSRRRQGPDRTPALMRSVLSNRLTIQGFIVLDFDAQAGDFLRDVGGWLRAGKLKYREDVVHGLEKAPEALIGLLQGRNFGKLLVKVAEAGFKRARAGRALSPSPGGARSHRRWVRHRVHAAVAAPRASRARRSPAALRSRWPALRPTGP